MVVAGTGHRPQKLGKEWDGRGPISDALFAWCILRLKELNATKVISGMALGFDMILAEAALSLGIPVIAAVPFKGQESKWFKSSIARYKRILANPLVTTFIVSDGAYSNHKMQIRNEWMVDNSLEILACWDGSEGGTANCYRYAKKKGKTIHEINPKHIV